MVKSEHIRSKRSSPVAFLHAAARAVALVLFNLVVLADTKPAPPPESAPTTNQAPPRVVASFPPDGATEVDPAIKEITVTFDQDMQPGFSFTGNKPEFPPSPEGAEPDWRDKRTCFLPVQLEPGRFYRVGINSSRHHDFRNESRVPAVVTAIFFTTKGATPEVKARMKKPRVLRMEPPNGASDVDPELKQLKVTFDIPMGAGFSWTKQGPKFPPIPVGEKPSWSSDKKTCFLPVQLKPASEYQLGLNNETNKNFQSSFGVFLDPVTYSFKTAPK
jgi:hypothetical protein